MHLSTLKILFSYLFFPPTIVSEWKSAAWWQRAFAIAGAIAMAAMFVSLYWLWYLGFPVPASPSARLATLIGIAGSAIYTFGVVAVFVTEIVMNVLAWVGSRLPNDL